MESATPQSATSTPAPEKKKDRFETVVTSTPVLLTVIATFLVGQSTSEMTRAQYYRSLASQNQSKVADQWGFYQAKRIRGQILDGNADVLRAQSPTLFSRDTFPDAAQAMVEELTKAESWLGLGEVNATLDPTKEIAGIAGALNAVIADAKDAAARTKDMLNPPPGGWKGDRRQLDRESVEAALDVLKPQTVAASKEKMPAANGAGKTDLPLDPDQAKLLDEVVAGVKQRKHESELNASVLRLQDAALVDAIKAKDRLADEVFQRGKKIENVLAEFDALVDRQSALVFAYQQISARLKRVLLKAGKNQLRADSGERLKHYDQAVGQVLVRLQTVYNAARHAYSARRYEDDARSNQDSAYLYEVRVYLNSARSDKHLYRSKMFLFATLVAQAGVTIATLALAVRRRSVFWLLAAITGLIAIGFGLYVYLDLGPMLL